MIKFTLCGHNHRFSSNNTTFIDNGIDVTAARADRCASQKHQRRIAPTISHFGNFENKLPCYDSSGNPIYYVKWDTFPNYNPLMRYVVGSDGTLWFTRDHYSTFNKDDLKSYCEHMRANYGINLMEMINQKLLHTNSVRIKHCQKS